LAQFNYTAISRDGAKVTGVVEAYDELDAASRIKESCDIIERLVPVKSGSNLLSMDFGANKLNARAFTVMCSQFAIILDSGIPISRAVHLIAEKTVDKNLHRVMTQVATDVEGGRSLSASMADNGAKLFPENFIETIRAGEATGDLARSFKTMQEQFEKQYETKRKVKSAVSYPAFIFVLAIGVMIYLMVGIVPKFIDIFVDMGTDVPGMMKLLMGISSFFQHYTIVLIAAILGVIMMFKLYGATESGRLNLAKTALKMPVLGKIQELSSASQFAHTMANMMSAGITMDRSVSITARVIDNYWLRTQTDTLSRQLEEGKALGSSMRELTDYPDILVEMTAVGESSGEMEKTLKTIGKYYDNELDEAIRSAMAKLEPAILILTGGMVAFIVIAVYSSMFDIYGAISAQ
jgi:type IV pilus assembly protein PilC